MSLAQAVCAITSNGTMSRLRIVRRPWFERDPSVASKSPRFGARNPMSDDRPTFRFLAVLVFDAGPGRRDVEPHVFAAGHPEVAYHLALKRGAEGRYGRAFV